MLYQVYQDTSKRTVEEKIRACLALFRERHHTEAKLVLAHPDQVCAVPGVAVIAGPERGVVVQPNCFFVGLS